MKQKVKKILKVSTSIKNVLNNATRIVIKIGSVLLVDEKSGEARQDWLNTLASDISILKKQGKEIVIVSSGAIALGRKELGIDYTNSPSSIPLELKQAAAALGNVEISQAYAQAFAPFDTHIALILLSPKDTEERRSHLNARATISTLLAHGKVPVINENDTVSTAEIRFGDNDRLASRVAQMIGADLLIQFSTTDGLYTADPSEGSAAEHIAVIENYSDDLMKLAGDAPKGLSTGGMKSKLEAARIATKAGVHMIIASGKTDHPIQKIEQGAKSTLFMATDQPINARKRWISSHVNIEGALIIDDGAAKALEGGKSLLPAGVAKVEGDFDLGDAVQIKDIDGNNLAIGLVNYNSNEARLILGNKSAEIADVLGYHRGDTLIHRDDLVIS